MYLLDKKIYLKFHQIEKILSAQNSDSEISITLFKKAEKVLPRQTIKKPKRCFRLKESGVCQDETMLFETIGDIQLAQSVLPARLGNSMSPKCATSSMGEFNEPKVCF